MMKIDYIFDCGGGYTTEGGTCCYLIMCLGDLTNALSPVHGYETTGFRIKLYDNEA